MRLDVVTPEFDRMDDPPGLRVHDRLERMLSIDKDFEILIVHRDCEGQRVADRLTEIRDATQSWACIGRLSRSFRFG